MTATMDTIERVPRDETDGQRRERLARSIRIARREGFTRLAPLGRDKTPYSKWKNGPVNLVTTDVTDEMAQGWIDNPKTYGIAILPGDKATRCCGLDVEAAGMENPVIADATDSVIATFGGGRASLNGQHVIVQTTDAMAPHGQALARTGPEGQRVLLAEIRGHSVQEASAGTYIVFDGPGREVVPEDWHPARMTRTELEVVLGRIRSQHEPTVREEARQANRAQRTQKASRGESTTEATGTSKVLIDMIEDGTLGWLDILPKGWQAIADPDLDRLLFLRPGDAESGQSANAVGHYLTVWSAAVEWAPTGEAMTPAQLLAEAWFDSHYGDALTAVEEAAQALAEDGERPDAGSPFAGWNHAALIRVHEARIASIEEWRKAKEADEREFVDQLIEDEMDTESVSISHGEPEAESPSGSEGERRKATFADMVLRRDQLATLPKPEPLIHGTLDKLTVAALVGDTGTLKTFIALDWAACVATGTSWHGRLVEAGTVFYVASEGAHGLEQRIAEWEHVHGVKIDPERFRVFPRPIQIANAKHRGALTEYLREYRPDLTVYDTVARCAVGLDENSAKDMGELVDGLYRLREASGGTIAAVHHTGKDGRTTRGSSAFEDGVNTVYLSTGDAGVIELNRTKRKDGPTEDRRRFTLKTNKATDNAYLQLVTSDVITDSPSELLFLMTRIDSHFGDAEVSMTQIVEVSTQSRATTYRYVKQLVDLGRLKDVGTKKTRRFVMVRKP